MFAGSLQPTDIHPYIIQVGIETARDFSNAWKQKAIKAINHASTFPYISMESSLHVPKTVMLDRYIAHRP